MLFVQYLTKDIKTGRAIRDYKGSSVLPLNKNITIQNQHKEARDRNGEGRRAVYSFYQIREGKSVENSKAHTDIIELKEK